MIDSRDFRQIVVVPALLDTAMLLGRADVATAAAEELLMLTAAVESTLGKYLRQIGGPAVGVFQMEPNTIKWIGSKFPLPPIHPSNLGADMRLAAIYARLFYWTKPGRLPSPYDLRGLAAYWKEHYNTQFGKGTIAKAMVAYKRCVYDGKAS